MPSRASGVEVTAELLGLAELADLAGDPRTLRWIQWAGTTGSPSLARFVRMKTGGRAISRLLAQWPWHIPRQVGEIAGPILLGREVTTGWPVGFYPDEPHTLVVGATRFGKSRLAMCIMAQLIGRIPFWAFSVKREYRGFASRFPSVYPLRLDRDLRLNPLNAFAELPAKNRYQTFLDLWSEGQDLLSGSKAYGLELLERLFDGPRGRPPTLFEFRDLARTELAKARPGSIRSRYCERIWTRLVAVTSVFGEVLDCAVGFPFEELAGSNIIWEWDGIDTLAALFMIRMLLRADLDWRIATGQQGSAARQFIFLDEPQEVLSDLEEGRPASGVPHMGRLVARCGEYSMFLVALNQNLRLAHAIRENSRSMVCFNVTDGDGRADVGRMMGLDRDQLQAVASLGVGEAIVRLASRCPNPVGMRVFRFPIEGALTDEGIAERVAPFLEHLNAYVVPAERGPAAVVEEPQEPTGLTWEEEGLLRDVLQCPALDWQQRSRRVREHHGIGPTAGRNARERLDRRGLVEVVSVQKGAKRGSSFKGLVLTPKGREYLSARGVRVGKAGRGNARHRFWVEVTRAHHEAQGDRCEVECELADGVYVDLLVSGEGGFRTGIEIELSTETAIRNITKLQGLGLDRIVLGMDGATLLDAVQRKCERELPGEVVGSVEFTMVQDFLPCEKAP